MMNSAAIMCKRGQPKAIGARPWWIPLFATAAFLLSPASPCAASQGMVAEPGADATSRRLSLAASLRASGEYSLSALEYRRLAAELGEEDPSFPALHLAAADAYGLQRRWDRMGKMLDAAEDSAADAGQRFADALLFLRLRRAEGLRDWTSAAYYAEDLAAANPLFASWAGHAAAADFLRAGDTAAARAAIGDGDQPRLAAIDRHENRRAKSPTLGGILGIIPGMGYAYSGEWGNMFRSAFLNGLFGWAMFECAHHERWGLFAITTFFELTWYSGSIYGGIDAAHRYNENQSRNAADALREHPDPRLSRDPSIEFFSLGLTF